MKRIIDGLYKYGVFALCIIILIMYIIYSAKILKTTDTEIIIVNLLLLFLNLFAAIYIASRISVWGWQGDNLKNQKKLAKTSIRHIRGYLTQILKIQKIISAKIDETREKDNRDLIELRNHLDILYTGIQSSELDFNELVNEELKEQNIVEIEVLKILEELSDKTVELDKLKGNAEGNKEKISELSKKVFTLERALELEKSKLTFTNPILDASFRIPDFGKLPELVKQYNRILSDRSAPQNKRD